MTDDGAKGIKVSEQGIDLVARVETDDGGNWFRGVLVAIYTKPLSAWHGDSPGVQEDERIIWTGVWRQSDPSIPDFNYGERRAIDEAVTQLGVSLTGLLGGRA